MGNMNAVSRHRESFIMVTLTLTMLFLSLWPLISLYQNKSADQSIIPLHNDTSDYMYYVTFIRQGMDGNFFTHNRYTAEPHSAGMIHVFYAILGNIGALVGLADAHTIYLLFRIVLAILWHLVMYLCVRVFVHTSGGRISAYILAVTTASLPFLSFENATFTYSWYGSWWTEFDPIKRATFIPHFTMGHILITLLYISTLEFFQTKKIHSLLAISLLSLIAATVHPPSFLWAAGPILLWKTSQIFIIFIYTFIKKVQSKTFKLHTFLPHVLSHTGALLALAVAMSVGIIPLLAIQQTFTQFPWTITMVHERKQFPPQYFHDLFYTLGFLPYLASLGLLTKWKKPEAWLLGLWGLGSIGIFMAIPILFSYFPSLELLTGISNIRFLQTALWLPLAILANYILDTLNRRFGKVSIIIFWGMFILITLPGYPQTLQAQIDKKFGGPQFNTPTASWLQTIKDISSVTQPNDRVFAMSLAGLAIPTYNNVSSYIGMEVYNTPDIGRKIAFAWKFYNGQIPPCDAYTEFKKYNITAVFYGYDEQSAGRGVEKMNFLTLAKDFGGAKVYAVNSPSPPCLDK